MFFIRLFRLSEKVFHLDWKFTRKWRVKLVSPGLVTRFVTRFLSLLLLTACTASESVSESNFSGAPPQQSQVQTTQENKASFALWVKELRKEALEKGIDARLFDQAFEGITPIEKVIDLDRKQPEFVQNFWTYFKNMVSTQRIETGRRLLVEHKVLLNDVEQRYGVPAEILVAFWGLETNYGSTFGNYPVIRALATLAYDQRRSSFFHRELLNALTILQKGDIAPAQMEGSWAGAMGHMQFMPSTFLAHAIDDDGDGRRDIWNSLPDAFASAANYLRNLGWRRGEKWGFLVKIPENFDYNLVSIQSEPELLLPLTVWGEHGITTPQGQPLAANLGEQGNLSRRAALVLPAGSSGPAFLVFENYKRILQWNRSIFYALSIGHLSDILVSKSENSISVPQQVERISYKQVKEMQQLLNQHGFDTGGIDGQVGPKTRRAIRDFQKNQGLLPDAYASLTVLQKLRSLGLSN